MYLFILFGTSSYLYFFFNLRKLFFRFCQMGIWYFLRFEPKIIDKRFMLKLISAWLEIRSVRFIRGTSTLEQVMGEFTWFKIILHLFDISYNKPYLLGKKISLNERETLLLAPDVSQIRLQILSIWIHSKNNFWNSNNIKFIRCLSYRFNSSVEFVFHAFKKISASPER